MPVKFYAVRAGLKPGIYYNWDDCRAQVTNFKGPIFKSFTSLTEAEAFLNGAAPSRSQAKPKSKTKTQKFYGVRSGHVPGIYTDWETAEAQIKGFSAPRYKAFPTYQQAQAFVNGDNNPGQIQGQTPTTAAVAHETTTSPTAANEGDLEPPAAKRRKTSQPPSNPDTDEPSHEPGDGPLPPNSTDGFDPRITLNPVTGIVEYKTLHHLNTQTWTATTPAADTPLKIWTDGSSLGNGALGAVAGIGVYFGPANPKNLSEPLPGVRQTNQRAELAAIQRALELSPRNRRLQILTDSNYAIKCVTEWFVKWRANDWLNAARKPVENRDLIEKVLGLLEERARVGGQRSRVEFVWVKGHAGDVGNSGADELAVAGAREAKARIARGEVVGGGEEGEEAVEEEEV